MQFVFMLIFLAFLVYVSYFKIVALLFKGKQYNRIFATLLCTILPVIGSVPSLVMATQYERKVSTPAKRLDDRTLMYATAGIQLLSVLFLFLPFFSSANGSVSGMNMIFGSYGGDVLVKPSYILIVLIALPVVSGGINFAYNKNNVHNVITYVSSLICALALLFVGLFSDLSETYRQTSFLWLCCIVNVAAMLFSIYSVVRVRNAFLEALDSDDQNPTPLQIKKYEAKDAPTDACAEPETKNTYKCAKCGSMVQKGTICQCRMSERDSLDKIMTEQNKKETSNYCVYCKKALAEGEKCDCVGEGFGITVKPEQFEGRKCKYCGQILVGDSMCVCEKIIKNSKPASSDKPANTPRTFFENAAMEANSHISDELNDLEKMIEERFSKVKSSLSSEKKD